MKILQHGKMAGLTPKQITCKAYCVCGCIFSFTKDEPLIQCKTYPNGVKHYMIYCPECGNVFHIRGSVFLQR